MLCGIFQEAWKFLSEWILNSKDPACLGWIRTHSHSGSVPNSDARRRFSMAHASKHNMGPGAQGKKSGSGAMTELPDGLLPENMVLSNRDKSRHTDQRGLDSKNVQTEQYQDHAGNRQAFDEEAFDEKALAA